jgi:hypothetical protein
MRMPGRRPRVRTTVGVAVLGAGLVAAAVVVVVRDHEETTPVAFGDAQELVAPVEVVVTVAEWVPGSGAEVAGYVSGLVESDGRLETTRAATADATTTACGWLTIDDPEITPGTWTATLSYQSSTTAAHSPETPLDVQ